MNHFIKHFMKKTITLRPYLAPLLALLLAPLLALSLDARPIKVRKDIKVVASLAPQAYIAKRLGGPFVEVKTLVPKGASPEGYDLKPSDIKALVDADVYIKSNMPYEEKWLSRLRELNPSLVVVGVDSHDFARLRAHGDSHATHSNNKTHDNHADHDNDHATHDNDNDHDHATHDAHSDHGDHDHATHDSLEGASVHHAHSHAHGDPHTWLSFTLIDLLASRIEGAYASRDATHASDYHANLLALHDTVALTKSEFASIIAGRDAFFIYHPALGYLAREFSLRQISIEEEGVGIKMRSLIASVKAAKKSGLKTLLYQSESPIARVKSISTEYGFARFEINPLRYEWPEMMLDIAKAIAK